MKAILLLLMLALNGCGFKLRSAQVLPEGFSQIYVMAGQDYSPLKRTLQEYLTLYQIPFVLSEPTQMQEQTIAIYLQPDSLDRRLLSLFSTGQVAEYELVLTIRFQVIFPGKEAQSFEFDVTREYQDDPDAILAKSRELDLVLSELRRQAVDRLVRMLPSIENQTS
ncbi:MAG: LPS exporter LptE [Aliiglaciecola sp.]|nr:hypothetical protein FM019_06070 [Aliiglaciecola sp. M165]